MFCCVTLRRTVRELRACEKLFSLNLTPLAACVCGVWRRAAAKCVFPLFSALKNFVYDMLYIKIPHFLSSTQWYRFQPSQAVKKCVQKLCCWVCMKSLGKMVVIAQGIFDLRVLYQEKIRFEKCAQKVGILKFFFHKLVSYVPNIISYQLVQNSLQFGDWWCQCCNVFLLLKHAFLRHWNAFRMPKLTRSI